MWINQELSLCCKDKLRGSLICKTAYVHCSWSMLKEIWSLHVCGTLLEYFVSKQDYNGKQLSNQNIQIPESSSNEKFWTPLGIREIVILEKFTPYTILFK